MIDDKKDDGFESFELEAIDDDAGLRRRQEEEKRLLRKIDMRLMPLMMLICQYRSANTALAIPV